MACKMFRFALFSLVSLTLSLVTSNSLIAQGSGVLLTQDADSNAGGQAKRQPPPVIDSVTEVIQSYVTKGRASGAVALVAHQGKVVHFDAVGLRDIASEKAMQRWSRFAIASMSKPITATAVMILHEEGKLNINDPLDKYLPEFTEVRLKNGDPVNLEIDVLARYVERISKGAQA